MTAESLSAVPLEGVVRLAGAVFTAGVSIYVLIAKKPPSVIFDRPMFSHTRGLIAVVIGVFLSLSWGLLGNSAASIALASIAVVATFLGFVAFFWVVALVEKPKAEAERNGSLLLFAYVIYSILISWGLTAATIFLSVLVLNPFSPLAVTKPVVYRADGVIVGTTSVTSNSEVPFRVSSGQVNFGCEESRPVTTSFSLPQNATFVGSPSVRWENFSNYSARQENVTVENGRAVGQGTVRGLDYQSFGFGIRNCRGGGHAELIVEGVYGTLTSRISPREVAIASSFSTATAGPVRVTLPTAEEMSITAVRLSMSEESPEPGVPETVELSAQARTASFLSGKVKATLDLERREIVLERGSSTRSPGA